MNASIEIRSPKIALGSYFVTGVVAWVAEALHPLRDIIVSGFLLVAACYPCKAADQVHLFG